MGFRKDSEGQIFSIDLLLALIPLTIIIGMAAADMDNILYLTQGAVFQSSTDRVAADTITTLLETSGDPVDWELNGTPRIPGLANYDTVKKLPIEGTVDPIKLAELNQTHMVSLIGDSYNYFLNVSRVDTGVNIKTIGTYNSSAKNIVRYERFILYGYLNVVSSAKNLIRYNPGPPRVYTSPPNPFPTNKNYLQVFDYWVLVVNKGYNSATVEINNNRVIDPSDFTGPSTRFANITKPVDPTFMFNQTDLMNNTVTVRGTSNPWDSMDVYVIQVPKGTPKSDITLENVEPKRYRFQLYLWVK
ncbi:MAG: hypothetical protein HZC47_07630 [Methanobacterium sp.]|uniref:hypothetical protein n=1 Tax=Methanobacterium sp. TaxID=2164 RepID=UPI003D64E98E|nr:hypothetical protein [Methanobacterium sp.]